MQKSPRWGASFLLMIVILGDDWRVTPVFGSRENPKDTEGYPAEESNGYTEWKIGIPGYQKIPEKKVLGEGSAARSSP